MRGDLLRNLSPSGGDWLRGEFSIFLSGWQVANGHQKLLRKAVLFLDHKLLLFEIKDIFTAEGATQTLKSISEYETGSTDIYCSHVDIVL